MQLNLKPTREIKGGKCIRETLCFSNSCQCSGLSQILLLPGSLVNTHNRTDAPFPYYLKPASSTHHPSLSSLLLHCFSPLAISCSPTAVVVRSFPSAASAIWNRLPVPHQLTPSFACKCVSGPLPVPLNSSLLLLLFII